MQFVKNACLVACCVAVIPSINGFCDIASKAYVDSGLTSKQEKDNTDTYKVGYNGGWADVASAVDVDTAYLNKNTSSSGGLVTIAIDPNKVQQNGTALDASSTKLISEKAVAGAIANKHDKPTDVAYGKVLTYTGNSADNISAAYIKVPVSTGAPSIATPTGFVELWVQ